MVRELTTSGSTCWPSEGLEHTGPADSTFYFLLGDGDNGASINMVNIDDSFRGKPRLMTVLIPRFRCLSRKWQRILLFLQNNQILMLTHSARSAAIKDHHH